MLAYEEHGEGQPVIFVHGLGADRSRWQPAIGLLEERYRCIAVDLPGHGDSPDESCDVGSAANAVHDVAEALALRNPVVVGHSLGASVAFVYGAAFRPRSVVAVDPVGVHLRALSLGLAPLADRLRDGDWEAAFGEWESLVSAGPLTSEQRTGMAEHSRLSRDVVLSYWATLLDPDKAAGAHELFTGVLAAIAVPTLVLLGGQPSADDAEMLRLIGPATTELWDGIGHYPQVVDPERFAKLVVKWIG